MQSETTDKVLVEYQKEDFRGFIFVIHEEYGLLLLRCTRKKTKPPHWQLPGGHIDAQEFLNAGKIIQEKNLAENIDLLRFERTQNSFA